MLRFITISGEYKGDDVQGMMIGGKLFKKGFLVQTSVDEDTFLKLKIAEKNGWFKLVTDNYDKYLISRGRQPQDVVVKKEEPKKEEPKKPVVEKKQEPKKEEPQDVVKATDLKEEIKKELKEESKGAKEEPKKEEKKDTKKDTKKDSKK